MKLSGKAWKLGTQSLSTLIGFQGKMLFSSPSKRVAPKEEWAGQGKRGEMRVTYSAVCWFLNNEVKPFRAFTKPSAATQRKSRHLTPRQIASVLWFRLERQNRLAVSSFCADFLPASGDGKRKCAAFHKTTTIEWKPCKRNELGNKPKICSRNQRNLPNRMKNPSAAPKSGASLQVFHICLAAAILLLGCRRPKVSYRRPCST